MQVKMQLKKIAVVHRGKVSIMKYYHLSHDLVTLRCKSQRFDSVLIVFIRRWNLIKQLRWNLIKHDALLWLVGFQQLWLVHIDLHCSGWLLPPKVTTSRDKWWYFIIIMTLPRWTTAYLFHDINLRYGCTALRLIQRHECCSSKLARYTNHLTFLTKCIKNPIVPKDLQVRPPVPTRGACRLAKLAAGGAGVLNKV